MKEQLSRRRLLAGMAVAGAAAQGTSVALASSASAGKGASAVAPPLLQPQPPTGPLLDRERALTVMESAGLDALIVGDPVSVYHFSGFSDSMVRRAALSQTLPPTLAVVPRNPALPVALVTTSFAYYYMFADVHRPADCQVYLVTDPADNGSILATGREVAAASVYVFPDRGAAPLDAIESRRAESVRARVGEHSVSASTTDALKRAIKDLGLGGARIGTDLIGPGRDLLGALAPGARIEPGETAVTRIRIVKSPVELGLMRYAARANAEAALAAAQAVRAGASYRDFRTMFFTEAARRGNLGVWIIIDRVKPEAFDAPIRNGQAFLIDAVSSYLGYHGDYGRTVFVGEPTRSMVKATSAISTAWDGILEKLRPGMRFNEIRALGAEILKKSGHDTGVRFTPHSVGLAHTDSAGLGDVVLEKGMVLSVDCPVMEAGIGGSAHLEDLTIITGDGHEVINDRGNETIVV